MSIIFWPVKSKNRIGKDLADYKDQAREYLVNKNNQVDSYLVNYDYRTGFATTRSARTE